jgi:hypothetical protein
LSDPQTQYFDTITLKAFIEEKVNGFNVITNRNVDGYEGMVLCIMIRFDTLKSSYQLDLQWECLGLDLFGDALWESYIYEFDSVDKLLDYLLKNYDIRANDIPLHYKFDSSQFPNPIYYEHKKPEFEAAWKRFEEDFKKGVFLDPSLKLVFAGSYQ